MLLCTLRGSSVLKVLQTSSCGVQGASDASVACAATQRTDAVNAAASQCEFSFNEKNKSGIFNRATEKSAHFADL